MAANHLILLAHGSPEAKWREPFEALAGEMGRRLDGAAVHLAYLGTTSPSLPESISEAVRGGAQKVLVFPLFMAGGGHVTKDVAVLVAAAQKRFPEVEVTLLQAAGEHPLVIEALCRVAREAVEA